MKNTKILATLEAIEKWCSGETGIQPVLELIGDDHNEVGQMLMLNGIADFSYKLVEGFSYQAVVNAVLLYLAMRGDIRKKAKP